MDLAVPESQVVKLVFLCAQAMIALKNSVTGKTYDLSMI